MQCTTKKDERPSLENPCFAITTLAGRNILQPYILPDINVRK